ncbi:tyrosine-type recombinase/integrase [Polynucleobacter sphagniphilus]|jgi:integrase|uniref:tyrosine-type recombinase/integrase n=1 Tax=Polynucleobacter sphagniphilus TaxID=1743169 RepID=UPI002476BBE0|nr:tyrosine-type recombinase/integrase [Polynucleobacter sphagniphilus]MDH6512530.1 integrase [Polynucleobacter sphagniphilus]
MSSLQQLFATQFDAKIIKQVKLMNGKALLYMRPQSVQWQVRFKLANNKWHSTTTNTTDIEQAKINAIAIIETVKIKTDAGLAITTKTFKQIALDEIANMSSALANNTGRRCYRDYIFATNKYLIPFFGKYEVEKITTEMLCDFDAWRISEMGKIPVASTKRNHASAYIRVVNLARERGYVGHNRSVPLLDAKGKRSQPRPAFTNEEMKELLCYTETWQKSSYTERTRLMRTLCVAYIEFLVNTGVRHGTEALRLRWKHLQWHWIGNKKYLRVWVSGKTGPRYLIAKHEVIKVFERLMRWHKLDYTNLNGLIEAKLDKAIFCLPDNTQISNMENIFRNLMVRSSMRKDSGGLNRTLYSLRHTYATFALASGIDIHTLAKQMGTSVNMIERHYSKMTATMAADRLA